MIHITYEDVMRIAWESDTGFDNGPDADGMMADSIVGITAVETFARAIESAVITNLRNQSPAAWWIEEAEQFHIGKRPFAKAWTPLYSNPMPPDDVVQDAERYQELLYAVQRKFPNESRHETALRYIKHAEAPSYSNAAKESK